MHKLYENSVTRVSLQFNTSKTAAEMEKMIQAHYNDYNTQPLAETLAVSGVESATITERRTIRFGRMPHVKG